MAHPELGNELLDKVVAELADVGVTDQKAELSGKYLTVVLRRK